MSSEDTQDFQLWKQQIEAKLKGAAVDLIRDRPAINTWIWGLLGRRLQHAAPELRAYNYEQIHWEEYVDILEEKFALANARNYQIHLFQAKVQQPNQTVLEFHSELHLAFK